MKYIVNSEVCENVHKFPLTDGRTSRQTNQPTDKVSENFNRQVKVIHILITKIPEHLHVFNCWPNLACGAKQILFKQNIGPDIPYPYSGNLL